MTSRFDPITLEVLWTRIISVVDEAAKAIVRTSFSTLSNEANDFACVLTDARGFALAQNSGSIPSFIGTLPATVRHFLAAFGDGLRPGDVLITNDPWQGTGHMSDVCLVKPIFHGGRLVAFSATTSHMPDIGGRVRAIEARELFEEGIHIPLSRIIRDGERDQTLISLIRANVRTPDQTMGDIWAQVSANELMENRVRRLMEDYGLDSLDGLADELFGRSERAMREAIRAVPDGTYRYGFDTDGFEKPYTFKIALTVRGDEITADYTGSSPAQPRAINCVYAYTYAMTAYAVRCALLFGLAQQRGHVPAGQGGGAGRLSPQPEVPRGGGEPRPDRTLRASPRLRRPPPGHPRQGDGGRGLAPVGGGADGNARRRPAVHQRALLQWRHGRHLGQGRRARALVAEQYLEHAGGGGRAQQPALLPPQAAARQLGRGRPTAGWARAGHAHRERIEAPHRAELHGGADEVLRARLRGRGGGRTGRRADQRQEGGPSPPARAREGRPRPREHARAGAGTGPPANATGPSACATASSATRNGGRAKA